MMMWKRHLKVLGFFTGTGPHIPNEELVQVV